MSDFSKIMAEQNLERKKEIKRKENQRKKQVHQQPIPINDSIDVSYYTIFYCHCCFVCVCVCVCVLFGLSRCFRGDLGCLPVF